MTAWVLLALLLMACANPRRAACMDEFELYTRADSLGAGLECAEVGR